MKAASSFIDVRADLTAEQQERLGEVLDSYLSQLERGERPSIEALCNEHPDLEPAISHYVASLQWLQHAAGEAHGREQSEQFDTSSLELKRLGDYELLREVGRGGMGVVYEARQVSLNRRVALKVLPFAAVLDKKQTTRFLNEAQAAAGLSHPHIVPVYAVGRDRGTYFYSMQFIDGRSLEQLLAELRTAQESDSSSAEHQNIGSSFFEPITSRETIRRIAALGAQAASAIEHAHASGIIHRDIKPSNLLIDAEGNLWITDFGLAHCRSADSRDIRSLTRSGDVIGTLRYMSPEQATGSGDWIDGRTDVYALGATLYELLTLHPIVDAANRVTMLRQIEAGVMTAPRKLNQAIPSDLETILFKATAHEREDRYSSAAELKADLERFLAGRPVLARRLSPLDVATRWIARNAKLVAAIGAAMVLVLAAAIGMLSMLAAKNQQIADSGRKAEKHLQVANDVVFHFNERILPELEELPGSELLQAELARQAIDYCEAFADYAEDDKSLDLEAGRALMMAARLENQFSRPDHALSLFRRATQRLQRAAEGSFGLTPQLVMVRNYEAALLAKQGKIEEARSVLESILRQLDQFGARERKIPGFAKDLLRINHASVLALAGNEDGAVAEIQHALSQLTADSTAASLSSQHLPMEEDTDELRQQVLRSLLSLGQQPFLPNDLALRVLNQSLSLARSRLRDRSDGKSALDREAAYDLASISAAVGARQLSASHASNPESTPVQTEANQQDNAQRFFREAIEILQELSNQGPHVLRYRMDLAGTWNNLGQAELENQAFSDAMHAFQQSLQNLEVAAARSDDYRIQSRLGGVYSNLGLAAEGLGQLQTAADFFQNAVTQQQAALQRKSDCEACRADLDEHRKHYDRVTSKLIPSDRRDSPPPIDE